MRSVTIFDAPDSKIQFLETLLKGQEWSANIIVSPQTAKPGTSPKETAEVLARQLEARGYATDIKNDDSDHYVVHLRSISSDTDFLHLIHEMGLSKGIGYSVSHFHVPLMSALTGACNYANYIIKEPARLFSGIYLLGDISLVMSGLKNEKVQGNFFERMTKEIVSLKDPANLLQTIAGKMAIVQSLIYMKFANSGSELAYEGLKNHHKAHVDKGVDPTNISAWAVSDMQVGKANAFTQILKKYPIESGAIAQILGQVAFIGTSLMQIKQGKVVEGAKINVARGLTAIVAWAMFMKKPVHTEDKTDWQESPIKRGWQEFGEHPERCASLINTAASAIGLYASRKTGNDFQKYAESLWLVGDVIMFFAKSNHYGGMAARQEEPMIEAATRFMKELPLALSPSAEFHYIDELSTYLATHALNERNSKENRTPKADEHKTEHTALAAAIKSGISDALSSTTSRYTLLVTQVARLVERFAEKDRPAIIKRLAHSLHDAHGIYGSVDEIEASIVKHSSQARSVGGIKPPVISEIMGDIQSVVAATPGLAAPHVGLAIYDALKPSMQSGRLDIEQLDHHLRKEAAKTLGVPSQSIEPAAARSRAP